MKWQIHNLYGLLHILTGILALISALILLLSRKGTILHKQVGYVYVISMIILNVSAWGVMEFFPGKAGPFHIGSLVSVVFIFLGMYPVIWRSKNWLQKHYTFINGSVIGLFAAFFVEIMFRSFSTTLVILSLTLGISLLVTIVGTLLIIRYKPKISQENKVSS